MHRLPRLLLLLLLPLHPALAQEETPPPPLSPREVIESQLESGAGGVPEQRALQALDGYWALLWTDLQRRALQGAVARAEAAYAAAKGDPEADATALLALDAWRARARAALATTRAEESGAFYGALLGARPLALDAFPVASLPESLAPQAAALAAAERGKAATDTYYQALVGHGAVSSLNWARALIEAGDRLTEQELGLLGAQLIARRAHDRALARAGALLEHYGVERE